MKDTLVVDDMFAGADAKVQELLAEVVARWDFPILQTRAAMMMATMSPDELGFVDDETMQRFIQIMQAR